MQRAPQEAVLFDQEIAVLSSAFRLRKPDAFERANRLLVVIDLDLAFVQRVANARLRAVRQVADEAETRVGYLTDRRARVVELVGKHKNMNLTRAIDEGPTPEQANKPARIDPVQMLFEKELLTAEQVRDAREIIRVFEAVCRSLFARTMRWSIGADRSRPVTRDDDRSWLHAHVYLPWSAAIEAKDPGAFAMMIAILVDGQSVYDISRDHHMSWDSAVKRLTSALDLYRALRALNATPSERLTEGLQGGGA